MKSAAIKEDSIYIVGAGAQTPVGRSVLSTAAAVRCGISAYTEHSFMVDKNGAPMIVARAGWLNESLSLEDRIVTLATDAVREALLPLATRSSVSHSQIRVHLALSAENLPDAAQRKRVLNRCLTSANVSDAEPALVADGHAGGLLALQTACGQLRRGEGQFCLVGGADSWLATERLEVLELAGQLHSTNHNWGFTPGEGAGFCLITMGASARHFGMTPLAELLAVSTAQETKLMGTHTVCIGEGLTAAFQGVLNAQHIISHSYCDLNGEPYRANEYGFTICRTSHHFEDASSFTAAAECWGDVGAASGSLALTLPIAAWTRGYANGRVELAWSSSANTPLRAAALLKEFIIQENE